ncbi:hypothetical protein [Anaerotignum sp.]
MNEKMWGILFKTSLGIEVILLGLYMKTYAEPWQTLTLVVCWLTVLIGVVGFIMTRKKK